MTPERESRRNTRLIRKESIEVTVLSCPEVPSLEGTVLECSTLDASATGMRLSFKQEVPHAAVLDLEIEAAGLAKTCRLGGVVRWSRPFEDGSGHCVGIELQNPSSSHVPGWLGAIGSIFKRNSGGELAVWRDGMFEAIRARNP